MSLNWSQEIIQEKEQLIGRTREKDEGKYSARKIAITTETLFPRRRKAAANIREFRTCIVT